MFLRFLLINEEQQVLVFTVCSLIPMMFKPCLLFFLIDDYMYAIIQASVKLYKYLYMFVLHV